MFKSILLVGFLFSTCLFGQQKASQKVTPGMVPVGGMVTVMPNIQGTDAWQPPATGVIKDGFMRADGHIITAQNVTDGSKLRAGTTLPNMIAKFPRGNTTSGTTGGNNTFKLSVLQIPQMSGSFPSGDQSQSHTHSYNFRIYPGPYDTGWPVAFQTGSGSYTWGDYVSSVNDASQGHTHSTSVTLGTLSNTDVNNEPAYVETIWIIRVK